MNDVFNDAFDVFMCRIDWLNVRNQYLDLWRSAPPGASDKGQYYLAHAVLQAIGYFKEYRYYVPKRVGLSLHRLRRLESLLRSIGHACCYDGAPGTNYVPANAFHDECYMCDSCLAQHPLAAQRAIRVWEPDHAAGGGLA